MDHVAATLNPDELFIWVHGNGTATLLAPGVVCPGAPFMLGVHGVELQSAKFFSWMEAQLTQEDLNIPLASIRRIYIYFDSEVSEQDKRAIIDVFAYYQRPPEICAPDCCSSATNYACCPMTIEPWILPTIVEGELIAALDAIHSALEFQVDLEFLVVSDGSEQGETLRGWLASIIPPPKFHYVGLTMSERDQPVVQDPTWVAREDDIVICIVCYTPPEDPWEFREDLISSLLVWLTEARLIVYLECVGNTVIGLQEVPLAPFHSAGANVALPIAPLSLETVQGLITELAKVALFSEITDSLTRWGLAIFPF